ncbi:MAG: hypothetical protein RSF40_11345 [Oscillospiraceae bacterium]
MSFFTEELKKCTKVFEGRTCVDNCTIQANSSRDTPISPTIALLCLG